jgi:hypothetical protein
MTLRTKLKVILLFGGFLILSIILIWAYQAGYLFSKAEIQEDKIKGMRFDPAWYYFRGYTAKTLAEKVTNDAYNNNVNTIFMMTYNNTVGFYLTSYQDIDVEGGFGAQNMLGELLTAAHAKNIKVVAWLPINNFKKTWENHPDWRSKGKDGKDYIPASGVHFLSALHDSFQQWYRGFLHDLLTRYPSLDGIETAEGVIDWTWNKSADYNSAANQKYFATYPSGTLGDTNWVLFRAQGLTKLHEILVQEAREHGKKAYVVSGWAAKTDGHLMASSDIRDGCGFDFDGIMNSPYKPDFVIAEMMWQEWAILNPTLFTPDWTLQATNEFLAKVNGRVGAIVHIEMTPWPPDSPQVTPTNSQFETSLRHAFTGTQGAEFYDHYQAMLKNAMVNVGNVFGTITPDTTPPVISNVSAINIGFRSTDISWQTDELSTSQVEWGKTTSYGNSTYLQTTLTKNHLIELNGLSAGTIYHFRVKSKDTAGNLSVSGDYTLTTAARGRGKKK